MSLGTLISNGQTRGLLPEGLVKAFDLDIKVVPAKSEEHVKNFPLQKVPSFIGPHGYKIHEAIAVIFYLIQLHDPESPLLGKGVKDQAKVLQYMSFATSDFMAAGMPAIASLLGRTPYNKKAVKDAEAKVDEFVALLEKRLTDYTYLVGERVTAADLFFATCFMRPLSLWMCKGWRSRHPVFMRWFNTVTATPYLSWYKFTLTDKPVAVPSQDKFHSNKSSKKEGKKSDKSEKKAEKKPAQQAAPAEPKKAKHPLEALGKPKIPLDEWKREYSNKETREEALPYFWNTFYNDEEWSVWKVSYKYNDELTLTFMSNNLIGGFFARLSASVKYMFGCMVVYGENNNNGITGAFVIRGQDYKAAFDVAPDWESYAFEKLDATKKEDRDFIDNMWAWDQPVVVDGVSKEIADGKVLK